MPAVYRSVRRRRSEQRKPSTQSGAASTGILPTEALLRLFAATDLEMLIDSVFGVLQGVVSCAFASAFYRGAAGGFLKERDSRGREYSHEFMRRHAELSPAKPIALANPGMKIIPTRTGLTLADAELRKTTYYREIMQVQGWRHAVALCFWGDPPAREPIGVFSVYRTDAEKDFSEQEILRLAQVHPFVDAAVNRMYERETARVLRDGVAGA